MYIPAYIPARPLRPRSLAEIPIGSREGVLGVLEEQRR